MQQFNGRAENCNFRVELLAIFAPRQPSVLNHPEPEFSGRILVVVGLLILTGFDKGGETRLVDLMPEWLTTLTTQF